MFHKLAAVLLATLIAAGCDQSPPNDVPADSVTPREPADSVTPREAETIIAAQPVSIVDFAGIVASCQADDAEVELKLVGSEDAPELYSMSLCGALTAHEQQYLCWREVLLAKLNP